MTDDETTRRAGSAPAPGRRPAPGRAPGKPASGRPHRSRWRLPGDLRPDAIELHLELDPAATTFRGEAAYDLELTRRRRALVLHAADLRIRNVRLHTTGDVWIGRIDARPEDETVRIAFDRPVPVGHARLELEFRGTVRQDLRGLYRGETDGHAWLASQLCPTDARRAFPCFDEPGVKSTWRIRVTAPRGQAVISNAPIERVTRSRDGRRTTQFRTTPPLSAYLVAVAVGPFEATRSRRVGATDVRIHTLPGRRPLARFAREVATECLPRLEAWFDLDHPYPKLDLVALPAFAFGAMENAGAVFFRESILLLDRDHASLGERKRSAEVIVHELSHMWFGNLVTMAWWNDLWLNESFATWMAYEILDEWRPEWGVWLDFAHRREEALEADSLATSHPIAPRIRSAADAQENFDAITYTKGACVLRMLQHYLGREAFRDGIRRYVSRHREGTAEAADLWRALEEASGEPVERIVAPWTLQTGLPRVRVARRVGRRGPRLELSQDRFLLRAQRRRVPSLRARKDDAPRWSIPGSGRLGAAREPGDPTSGGAADRSVLLRHLLTKRRVRLPLDPEDGAWLYGNAAEVGFFRVEHGDREWAALVADPFRLAPEERIGLLGHRWALVQAGEASIDGLLDLVAALGGESEPEVLRAVDRLLGRVVERVAPSRGPTTEERLRTWIALHFGGPIAALGLESRRAEDERRSLRRAALLRIVGGHAASMPVIGVCTRAARRHLESGERLPRELGDAMLTVAARYGDPSLHTELCAATRRAPTPQARQRTLFALAEFARPALVRRSLAAVDDRTLGPLPDRAQLLALLLTHRTSAEPAWERLQKRWPRLERALPPILLARLARATARALPPRRAPEVRGFFARHPLAAGPRVVRQVGEELSIAARLEATAGPALEAYLTARAPV